MSNVYHEKLITCFVASDTRTLVYLKLHEGQNEYAVKVRERGSLKGRVVYVSHSLSSALRAMGHEVGQLTNDFTTWSNV